MKILIVTSTIAPYRRDWFNELSKYAEVKVVYTKSSDVERNKGWLVNDSQIFNLVKLGNSIRKNPLVFSIINILKNSMNYEIIMFDGYGPYTNILGMLYLSMKKKLYYVNVDGIFSKKENFLNLLVKKVLFKLKFYVLCSGTRTKEYLIKLGVKRERIYIHPFTSVLRSDIISDCLNYDEKDLLRKKLNLTGNKIVLTVSRFLDWKRLEDLMMSQLYVQNDIDIYIIGGSPTSSYLQLIKKNNLNKIHFVDFLDKETLKKYYDAADIFAFPSSNEVWGLVVNEAMSRGLPVIATDHCGAAEMLVKNNINGYIYESGNIKQLADCIDRIYDSDKLSSFSLNSKEIISDYTIENMAKMHYDIFNANLKREKYNG
ncbi:glycosyltransferase family 4 protein [Holdemania massiliensis]|uniref:glycosyltransferase family 4 protein n=1 Tax=Holdemania massiliensis TaxID=1468449 RepID=UPI002676A3FF|nr:glycosyltransferase family 4 protein [Holdemania massiliensis]